MSLMMEMGKFLLNVIYLFFKIFPTRNKVTFLSRQADEPSLDFILLSREIETQMKGYKTVLLCKRLRSGFAVVPYFFHMFVQMYHVATSKVVVLDSYCIVVSLLHHKKTLKVIQMWHALGCYKKFGYSILDKAEGSNTKVAKAMNMHCNYDYVFTSGEACVDSFAEAFGYPKEYLKVMGLPRLDLLQDETFQADCKDRIYQAHPTLENTKKKTILYAPTFRKNKAQEEGILRFVECVDFEKYNLILSLHPLSSLEINDARVIIPKGFTSLEMSLVSDYVITDYSAFVFEAAFLKKPLFFYTYDVDVFFRSRDFYIDFTKMPGVISADAKRIMQAIAQDEYNLKNIETFSKCFIKPSAHYTDDIVAFIKTLV